MKSKAIKRLAATLLFALLLTLPALAYADGPGAPDAVTIRITPPNGEASGTAAVEVRVTDNTGNGFESVLVKTADSQEWRDLTPYLEKQENRYYGAVEITENCTVYVRVTMGDGTAYEKSRYVECFNAVSDAPYTAEQVTGDPVEAPESGGTNTASPTSTALTPDGQGTVMDNATSENGKEFFTISTPAENVFYLIIDRERNSENVYFLNAVTEADLMALAETDVDAVAGTASDIPGITNNTPANPAACTCKDKCAPGEVDISCPLCLVNYLECKGVEREPDPEPEPEPQTDAGNSGGTIAIAVIVALAVGGAGYYFKIYKPKREADDAEDLDEVTGRTEEKLINEDDLPPYRASSQSSRSEREEPPEPDYPTYEDYQRRDEPPEPDYDE